ncbi:hypothetical protein ACVIGB_010291 [Bradyrhizobium sp. USDA 4341]
MSYIYADFRGNVVPFIGNLTVTRSDAGKIFRCDDPANVTVTVPADLDTGFNVGFIAFNTGTITLAPGSGAANRSGKTVLSTQYQVGSFMVVNKTGGDFGVPPKIDFLVGGDFA